LVCGRRKRLWQWKIKGRLLYTKRDEEDSELGYMGGGDFFRGYGEDKGGR
jgi:hypothetical protein